MSNMNEITNSLQNILTKVNELPDSSSGTNIETCTLEIVVPQMSSYDDDYKIVFQCFEEEKIVVKILNINNLCGSTSFLVPVNAFVSFNNYYSGDYGFLSSENIVEVIPDDYGTSQVVYITGDATLEVYGG